VGKRQLWRAAREQEVQREREGGDEGVRWARQGSGEESDEMAIDEREIERLARELGARAAGRIDVERTAQAVLQRVKEHRAQPVWWRRVPLLEAVASAAVIVLVAGVLLVGRFGAGNGDVGGTVALAELQELSTEELAEVFDSLLFEAPVYESSTVGLQDLNEEQLRELLELMEG
jgi:anti-sigma factor RsiW